MYTFESAHGTVRLIHEWFAGWRWELWRHGRIRNESLRSFESKEDCARDAQSLVPAAPSIAH